MPAENNKELNHPVEREVRGHLPAMLAG